MLLEENFGMFKYVYSFVHISTFSIIFVRYYYGSFSVITYFSIVIIVLLLSLCIIFKIVLFLQGGDLSAATMSCVSDGFMLNLGAVLLQLCQPFCTTHDDSKALKIDPTYGAVPVSISFIIASVGIHICKD